MESLIKARLEPGQINRLVQDAFGVPAAEIRELTDGYANTAYRIDPEGGGPAVVLKIAPLPETVMMRYETELMRTEVEAMELARTAGVPVPKVYRYDASCRLAPSAYFFMECLEGRPYNTVKGSLTEEEREAVEEQIGRYNRMINGIRGNRFGPVVTAAGTSAGRASASWKETFRTLIEGVLADGMDRSIELPFRYGEAEREIKRRLDVLDEVAEPRLIHWDLWDGNFFVQDGAVTGLIDWERALWGDPLMEFYFCRLRRTEAFLRGYGMAAMTPSEMTRRKLYDLYMDLIMLIECTYRQYRNPKHEKWAWDHLLIGWKGLLED